MLRLFALLLVLALIPGAAQAQTSGDSSPVALHAGPVFAKVTDVEFEVVGALSGQDLFAQVKGRENTVDFAVFLGQRLFASDDAGVRAYASVGTGVTRPGEVLFFGGSLGVSRALVTLGLATRLVDQGVGAAPDAVFRGSSDRMMYSVVQPSENGAAPIGPIQ